MVRNRVSRLTQRFDQWWARQPAMTKALPSYLSRALSNYFSYGARQAAALSYYAIFSIFPLILLLTIVLSRFVGPAVGTVIASQQLEFGIAPFLPPPAGQTLQLFEDNLAQVFEQGSSFSLIALVGLIWSGLGLFSNVTSSLDFIFHVPSSRSIWRQRVVALGIAFALVVLLTTSFVTSAVFRLVSALLLERPSLWINIGAIFLPLGLNVVIFAMLFRYVPARNVHWDAVWPAAIFGGIGWELAKSAFSWYLTNIANYQFIYGTLSTAIVLLFWAYVLASIFLLSAEFCAQINEWLLDRHWQEEAKQYLEGKATRLPAENQP